MAGSTGYPRLTAAGDSANDAFLDAITAAVDSFDAYVAKVNASATILAGDNTTFKMQGVNGPAVSGATRTVKVLGRPDSEHQVFLTVLNAISDTFAAYRTKVNANAAITGGDTTCYKVQALNGPTVSGATVFYRSDSRFDTDLDDTETQINGLVDALSQFASAWNLKQGGTPTALVVSTVRRLRPMQRSSTGGGGGGGGVSDPPTRNIAIAGGNSQSATVATQPSTPLTVTVTDAGGTVVSGDAVTWAITGDGSITSSSQTNASGVAAATPILGTLVGTYTVTATSSTGSVVSFTLTATAGAAAILTAASTTDQSATTSSPVGTPPSVQVLDAYGNPKNGVTVTFAVTGGGGSRSPATVDSAATTGLATLTSWTMGASAGLNTLTATAAGLTGSPVTFTANASASAPTQIAVQSGGSQTGVVAGQAATAVTFRVKDAGNTAVQGVTVSFSATGTGSLSVASAVTNASGDAAVTLTTGTTVETATVTGAFTNASGTVVSASTTIASTFGTKTKLALQTQPSSNGSSGTALSQQPIVLIQDANGNTVTNATDTVTAAVQSGNASITAGSTKAAVAGVATFSGLTMTDVDGGANVLRFSSGALTTVDSNGVTLAPPVPVALQFSGPIASILEDTGILSATVNVVDASNVIVPGATNAVTISLTTPGGATLGGTTTTNAVAGVATFATNNTVDTPGTYTLTATATGLTSAVSSSFTVTASSGVHPNEPAGFTQITVRPWDSTTENGWTAPTGGTLRTDGVGLPKSGPNYIRHSVPNNSTGTSLGTTEKVISSLNKTRLYAHVWFKLSDGFQGHSTATNKLGLWLPAGSAGNSFFVNLKGTGTGNLLLEAYFQGVPTALNGGSNSRRILKSAGMNQQVVSRGAWHHFEVDYTLNTYDVANGVLKMWFNGTLFISETDIGVRGTGGEANSPFWRIKWNPIWGGTGTANTSTTQIECDEIYVSG